MKKVLPYLINNNRLTLQSLPFLGGVGGLGFFGVFLSKAACPQLYLETIIFWSRKYCSFLLRMKTFT